MYIKAYVCSCKSGLKVAGACVHVATLIYYLSNAKYSSYYSPAEHLNSIFVNIDNQDLPNRPNIIKNQRGKKRIKIESDNEEKKEESLLSIEESKDQSEEPKDPSTESKDPSTESKDPSTESKDPSEEPKDPSTESKNNKITNNEDEKRINLEINNLKNHVPKWGANITYKNQKVFLSNTCTIDNFLFAFWVLYKADNNFLDLQMNDQSKTIIRIVKNIDKLNWDKAREIWVNEIMKYNEDPINNSISLFGSDRERFYSFLHNFQQHSVFQICRQNCDANNTMIYKDSVEIAFQKKKSKVELFSGISGRCSICKSFLTSNIRFQKKPSFIFVQSAYQRIFIHEIPKILTIDGLKYRFLCSTVYKPGHFVSIFDLNGQFFLIDDLDQSVRSLPPFNQNIRKKNKQTNYFYKKANTVSSLYYLYPH